MQRLSSQAMNDATATLVQIPNEEFKGRIIGKEGRNIRTFEHATGTTLMMDESPDSVLVSSFDPVRREIARIALEALVRDGRIHPANIEETVKSSEDAILSSMVEVAEKAILQLRLNDVSHDVLTTLGRLNYRLSNNQNTLEHSIEVSNFCALLAAELGYDVNVAKRAGLYHDIGKALTEEGHESHAIAGANFMKKHGENDLVVNAIAAHHKEVEPESVYASLVMIADSISATRPGVRTSSVDGFYQRVKSIEQIAKEQQGVEDAYAIQAGKELRVIVKPEIVDDSGCRQIARRIRSRIENELSYPGVIEVTVIREQRFNETAV
jgi:ribonuclease Y